MKQALRMSSAAVALTLGIASPGLAQDQATDASPAPPTIALPAPSSADAIGPAQLKDFSISGTVTRRADAAEPAAKQPAAKPATAAAAPTTPSQAPSTKGSVAAAARPERPAAQTSQSTTAGQAPALAATGSSFGFTPSAPAERQAVSFGGALTPATTPIVDSSASEGSVLSHWPWFLALLAAAGAALWYFRRQRPGYTLAGAGGDASAFNFSPAPARPESPKPAPRPEREPRPDLREPLSGGVTTKLAPAQGIISTRLRPWLDIEFDPQAAIIDAEKASIQFEVVIFNSGSAPARDVLVEAALFNAGADQDQLLGAFFGRQPGQSDGTTIPPLQRMSFRSIVTLPRDQLRLFEVEGRTLFVPVVGFNVHYRFSSGSGQSSTSFIVGRNNAGEKMAPFLVEKGSKTYRGLANREHNLRVRN